MDLDSVPFYLPTLLAAILLIINHYNLARPFHILDLGCALFAAWYFLWPV